MEKFHEGIWELATEQQWREAVLEEGAKESQTDMFWWTVYEAMTMVEFSKRISPERNKKLLNCMETIQSRSSTISILIMWNFITKPTILITQKLITFKMK